MKARLTRIAVVAAAACVLAMPPVAHGAGSMVEVDSVPGQIYDVSASKILFRKSDDAYGLADRSTHAVTTLAIAADRDPYGGRLTSHGALLVTKDAGLPHMFHLDELRDSVNVALGALNSALSLRVAGDWAIWSDGSALMRRDLDSGVTLQVASNAGNTENDVAANGDVAYWTNDNQVVRYRFPTSTTLATGDDTHREALVRTDGTNVVWREAQPCCGPFLLRAYGESAEIALADTARSSYEPYPGRDYTAAGGWIAFTRGEEDATEVWLRNPAGDETQVASAGPNRIAALAADGELLFATRTYGADGISLYRPDVGYYAPIALTPIARLTNDEPGYGDHVFKSAGRWYAVLDGSLNRISPYDTADGASTQIVSAPHGDSTPSHVSFSFDAPDDPDATFECKLDGGPYEPCAATTTYSSLPWGPHSLAVRSVDAAGHADTDPATAVWRVEHDPPEVTITSSPAPRSRDTTPHFAGAAGTKEEDAAAVTVRVYAGDKALGPAIRAVQVTRSGGTWSADVVSPLGDGEYTAVAEQPDGAGNVGRSQPVSFVIDATPPSVQLDVSPHPALTGHPVTFDAGGSGDPGGGAVVRHQWDLDGDGDFERDTGGDSSTSRTYADAGRIHPAVRLTDSVGNHAVERIDLTVAPDPPPGFLGVSIDDGDRFTNDPNVFVQPVWPPGATHVFLSNDGGFRDAVAAPLAANVPWRLDSSGPERLPKTIYARFSPNGTTYQDDIILDETPPVVVVARFVDAHTLSIRGRDGTAGISRMEITRDRSHPGKPRRYRRHVKVDRSDAPVFVRLRDRARNWSRWKRAEG